MDGLAAECGCHPDLLGAAISSLDGRAGAPELRQVFDQIRWAHPTETSAAPFFRAKLVEASTLVLDWYNRGNRRGNRVGAADMIAFNKARNLIVANLDKTVGMRELCNEAHMSENKLADVFKRVEGATPQKFARTQKLALAAHLLERTDLPLSAISARVGYGLQGSFSTAFKRQYGTTPRDYRRSAR